jgi:Tfp pilus assembly protein PilV
VIRRRPVRERGESLIELLVAITIMGITVVAVIGGLATSISLSDRNRQQAVAAAELRSFAAYMDGLATAAYDDTCPTAYSEAYPNATGYQADIEAIAYWTGSAFTSTCPSPDGGIQRLSLRVQTTDGRVVERMDIIIRRP